MGTMNICLLESLLRSRTCLLYTSLGMAYYYLICNYVIAAPIAFGPLFYYCFLMAVPGDILLCFLGAGLARRLLPVLGRKEMQKKRIQEETT